MRTEKILVTEFQTTPFDDDNKLTCSKSNVQRKKKRSKDLPLKQSEVGSGAMEELAASS